MPCSKKRKNRRKHPRPNKGQPAGLRFASADQFDDEFFDVILGGYEVGVETGGIDVDDWALFEVQIAVDDSVGAHHVCGHQLDNGSFDDDPYARLTGFKADKRTCAMFAVMQGPIEPSSEMAAELIPADDDDPNRFDVRVLFLVTRDGRILKRLCFLGGKRQGEQIDGCGETRLPDFMLRALGAEVEEPEQSAEVFWARTWVHMALTVLSGDNIYDSDDFRPNKHGQPNQPFPAWLQGGLTLPHDQWSSVYRWTEALARKQVAGAEFPPRVIRWMGENLLAHEMLDGSLPLGTTLPALAELDRELADELKATFDELEISDYECAIAN
jgi:hypothetical protein